MRESGKIGLVPALIGTIAAVFIGAIAYSAFSESPMQAGSKFMSALAKQDAATLADLTLSGGLTKEQIKKEWENTIRLSKHFPFSWNAVSATNSDSDKANMRLTVNKPTGGAYDENFGLPLEKEDGRWKVDVRNVSRKMYPNLPYLTKE